MAKTVLKYRLTADPLDFVEIALSDNVDDIAAKLDMPPATAGKLRDEMRELLGYWLASMDKKALARVDGQIVDKFKADMPQDSALLALRDFVNSRAQELKVIIDVTSGKPERAYQPTRLSPIDFLKMSIMETVISQPGYRLCHFCGKPFQFKSSKAMYCSTTCRTYASRATTALKDLTASREEAHAAINKLKKKGAK